MQVKKKKKKMTVSITDRVVSDCGSLGCFGTHSFTERDHSFEKYFVLTWKKVNKLSQCLLRERYFICGFCKKCIDCRRFIFCDDQISSIKE